MMCRADFADKGQLFAHLRAHFDMQANMSAAAAQQAQAALAAAAAAAAAKVQDPATAELIARGLVDPSGMCS